LNLQDLRRAALGRLGKTSAYFGEEDRDFPLPLLTEALTERHRKIAELTRCYRESQVYDLPQSSSGVSLVSLDCNVIEILPDTVHWLNGTAWTQLDPYAEGLQRWSDAPFEGRADGTPATFYTAVGSTVGGQRQLVISPGVSAAVTNGLRLDAYVYPGVFSATTDAAALQVAEHPILVTAAVVACAEIMLGRGEAAAVNLLQYWGAKYERELGDLRRVMDDFKQPGVRLIRYVPDGWD
jgi:hypothetical protein